MTRAEEAVNAIVIIGTSFRDINTFKKGFINGYEQAEKDLALTKDDVWCIFNLVRELQTKYPATEGCLQEVADIFNEQRNATRTV